MLALSDNGSYWTITLLACPLMMLWTAPPLYDPDNCFHALRSTFRLRSSYQREIGLAADLGWLIVHFADTLRRSPLIGRRVTWSTRSILIARSAEAGNPVFSATAFAALAPLPETRRLIAQKDASDLGSTALDDLRRFLTWCGLPDPLPNAREPTDFMNRFEATANAVALHFLASVENGRDLAGYS